MAPSVSGMRRETVNVSTAKERFEAVAQEAIEAVQDEIGPFQQDLDRVTEVRRLGRLAFEESRILKEKVRDLERRLEEHKRYAMLVGYGGAPNRESALKAEITNLQRAVAYERDRADENYKGYDRQAKRASKAESQLRVEIANRRVLAEANAELVKKLEVADKRIRSLDGLVGSAQSDREAMRAQGEDLKGKNDRQRFTIQKVRTERDELKKENSGLQERAERLQAVIAEQGRQMDDLEMQASDARRKAAELEADLSHLLNGHRWSLKQKQDIGAAMGRLIVAYKVLGLVGYTRRGSKQATADADATRREAETLIGTSFRMDGELYEIKDRTCREDRGEADRARAAVRNNLQTRLWGRWLAKENSAF